MCGVAVFVCVYVCVLHSRQTDRQSESAQQEEEEVRGSCSMCPRLRVWQRVVSVVWRRLVFYSVRTTRTTRPASANSMYTI